MKWLIVLPLFYLLTACIYTEATPIIEPEDVTVSSHASHLAPWEQFGTVDVTNPAH